MSKYKVMVSSMLVCRKHKDKCSQKMSLSLVMHLTELSWLTVAVMAGGRPAMDHWVMRDHEGFFDFSGNSEQFQGKSGVAEIITGLCSKLTSSLLPHETVIQLCSVWSATATWHWVGFLSKFENVPTFCHRAFRISCGLHHCSLNRLPTLKWMGELVFLPSMPDLV